MERGIDVEKPKLGVIDGRKAETERVEGRADGTIRERSKDGLGLKSLRGLETIVVRVAAANISVLSNQRSVSFNSMPMVPTIYHSPSKHVRKIRASHVHFHSLATGTSCTRLARRSSLDASSDAFCLPLPSSPNTHSQSFTPKYISLHRYPRTSTAHPFLLYPAWSQTTNRAQVPHNLKSTTSREDAFMVLAIFVAERRVRTLLHKPSLI